MKVVERPKKILVDQMRPKRVKVSMAYFNFGSMSRTIWKIKPIIDQYWANLPRCLLRQKKGTSFTFSIDMILICSLLFYTFFFFVWLVVTWAWQVNQKVYNFIKNKMKVKFGHKNRLKHDTQSLETIKLDFKQWLLRLKSLSWHLLFVKTNRKSIHCKIDLLNMLTWLQ